MSGEWNLAAARHMRRLAEGTDSWSAQSVREILDALIEALEARDELIRRCLKVDDTICWNVHCAHQAEALDKSYTEHCELRAELARANEQLSLAAFDLRATRNELEAADEVIARVTAERDEALERNIDYRMTISILRTERDEARRKAFEEAAQECATHAANLSKGALERWDLNAMLKGGSAEDCAKRIRALAAKEG
jgi:hypothetical protein